MQGLIIGSGNSLEKGKLELLMGRSDLIICADGGMNYLFKMGRLPDLILGDCDSISQEVLDYIEKNSIPIERFPVMKDYTDTELAIEYAINKGCKDITLTGVTGTRLDHTLGNIYLLDYIREQGVIGKIVDNNNTIYLIDDYFEIESKEDAYISLIPITSDGIKVSLSGFLYKLDKEYIKFATTKGISNQLTEEKGYINIHSGKALLFISKD